VKNSLPPAQPSQDGASFTRRPLTYGRISAARVAFAAIELRSPEATKANKNQQVTAGWFKPKQQTSTEINTIQQSQQKSAKVSKISPGPRVQSAKISNSQQKSACFRLVRKQLRVFLRADSAYWNIKECVTEDRRSPYKFLLQNAVIVWHISL